MIKKIYIALLVAMIFQLAGCVKEPPDMSDTDPPDLSDTAVRLFRPGQISLRWIDYSDYYLTARTYDEFQELITYRSPSVSLAKYDRDYFNDKMVIFYAYAHNQGLADLSFHDVLLENRHLTVTISVIDSPTMAVTNWYLLIEIKQVTFDTISIEVISGGYD